MSQASFSFDKKKTMGLPDSNPQRSSTPKIEKKSECLNHKFMSMIKKEAPKPSLSNSQSFSSQAKQPISNETRYIPPNSIQLQPISGNVTFTHLYITPDNTLIIEEANNKKKFITLSDINSYMIQKKESASMQPPSEPNQSPMASVQMPSRKLV